MSNVSISKPFLKIIPPIEQPTDFNLCLVFLQMICMTIGIAGNFTQIYIQFYAERFRNKSHVQIFLAIFFFFNASICFGAPWSMLEIISQQWSFSRLTCQIFEFHQQTAKTLLPYSIVAIYAVTAISRRPNNPHRTVVASLFVLIFIILTLLIVVRVAESAQLESHYLGEPIHSDENTVIFEALRCVVPFRVNIYTAHLASLVEIVAPLTLCLIAAANLKGTCRLRHLAAITVIHFGINFWWYPAQIFGSEKGRGLSSVGGTVVDVLPYLGASLTWIPGAFFSEFWANYETRILSPLSDDVFLPTTMRNARLYTYS